MAYLISKTPLSDLLTRHLARECIEMLRSNSVFDSVRILLVYQFGRPLPRVTEDTKIGDTLHVQKPVRWVARNN